MYRHCFESRNKKKYRDVIYVQGDDGNLVKYVRAEQNERPKRNTKKASQQPASRIDGSNKSERNAKATAAPPIPLAIRVAQNKPKRNVKALSTPPITRASASNKTKRNAQAASPLPREAAAQLKPYEIAAKKMNKCSVVLFSLTMDDIAKEKKNIKRDFMINKVKEKLEQLPMLEMCEFTQYAFLIESQLQHANGNIKFESVSDDALLLMIQYLTKDLHSNDNDNSNNVIVSTIQSGFSICLPDFRKIVISMPIWKHCTLNPLHEPTFAVGESWSVHIQSDGSLAVGLPEVNGKRETFVFSERIWHNWFGENSVQSCVESHCIQNQSAERDAQVNSSLSLMDIDTSSIVRLLGDDKLMAAFFSMSWLSESQTNISISRTSQNIDSTDDGDENGYDASVEVSSN